MIGIVGGGAFGTALAVALTSDGTEVRLWMRQGAAAINESRRNARRLPDVTLPETLIATENLKDLSKADAVLLAVPAQQTEDFLSNNIHMLPRVPLVLCAKGITKEDGKLQSELVPQDREFAVLTGPGFAMEIASGRPTALTLASTSPNAETLQQLLSRPALRLYRSDDIVGAQLGGALKNVIAIAAGIAIGAELGESARAAIVTRGFAEIRRLAHEMGANDSTLSGLSGFGDLMLTCASEKSRNFAFGYATARGDVSANVTIEGKDTAHAAVSLGEKHHVDMPVSKAVLQVLSGSSVMDVMKDLLARPLRAE